MSQNDPSPKECSPCRYASVFEHATYFCTDCSENLCTPCKLYHLRMRVTRNHIIIDQLPDSTKTNVQSQPDNPDKRPDCACGLREIEAYCKLHDEAVCSTCTTQKHENCDTCPLKELMGSFIVDKMKSVSQTSDEIQIKLEKIMIEGEEALRILIESYFDCKYDISQVANMNYDAQFRGKDRELNLELEKIMSKPRRMLGDQIEACSLSLAKLSNQHKRTQKYKVSEEKDKALDGALQLANILKDVTEIVEKIDGNIKRTKLVFKANEKLDILRTLTIEKWGEIKLEAAE